LRVVRGGEEVIPALTVEVAAGQITGLLGPSGSGKSTLMRAIVGVQIVAGGEVLVLGRPAGTPELRSRVGYVTQAPSVFNDLTVRANIRYFAHILGVDGTDVDRVMNAVDLTESADRRVGRLSGGQRSRVSLAVALLGSPELLILDEPTVGLDPVLRRDLWNLFHTLADEGITLLVSSHVMDEASRCHQLMLMRDGSLLAEGTLSELLAKTKTSDIESAFLTLVEGHSQ
ncbi:MAG TPA: ABC transporter ATP-binding protein, partial [Actinomycetes bacterium]|nr:ABC transporter ATP-binding protein [Actinomycetes bacterium]